MRCWWKCESARFRQWVKPDELIGLFATHRKQRRTTSPPPAAMPPVGGRKACSAELLFAFKPIEQFSPDYHDAVLEDWLASRNPA